MRTLSEDMCQGFPQQNEETTSTHEVNQYTSMDKYGYVNDIIMNHSNQCMNALPTLMLLQYK